MRPILSLIISPFRRLISALMGALPENVRDSLSLELRSFVGRILAQRLKVDRTQINYMNLGSGNDRLDGYLSVDFFSKQAGYGADLRYPLLIDDAVFNGIFTEHTLEHLNYAEVARVLAECHRTLKPGGVIRIIVPDLSIFVANYASKNEAWFRDWERVTLKPRGRSLISPMEALSFVTQEYGHRSAWDFDTMQTVLMRAGFTDIQKCAFNNGCDTRLLQDKAELGRRLVSLYVEARKGTTAQSAVSTTGG